MKKIKKQSIMLLIILSFAVTSYEAVSIEYLSNSEVFNASNMALNTQNSNLDSVDTNFSDQYLEII